MTYNNVKLQAIRAKGTLMLDEALAGVSTNGKMVVSGKFVFTLKDAHGMPLDFSVAYIYDNNALIDWSTFVDEAVRCKWYGYQIWDAILYALKEAQLDKSNKELYNGIKNSLMYYMWHNCPGFKN